MPSKTQETLLNHFQALTPDRGLSSVLNSGSAIASALEKAATQIGQQSGGLGGAVSTVTKIFTSGLGVVPLISGLLGLFGGGGEPEPPPLVKYAMPDRLFFQGASSGGAITSADYDQVGMPREYATVRSDRGSSASLPQVNVSVQAMDARSFLDHSAEIAQAVREAMLNLSPINDVVNDL